MDQISVLIVTPTEKSIGGVETMNEILKNILSKHSFTVDYLTCDEDQQAIPNWVKILSRVVGKPAITSYKFGQLDKTYDVVICNGEFSLGIQHPRLINYYHGSYWGLYQGQKNVLSFRHKISLQFQAWIQYFASFNREVVVVSEYLKMILSGRGIQSKWVINNPVDNIKFNRTIDLDQRKNYLFVGAYNYWAKGFDILEALAKRGHPIHCYSGIDCKESPLITHPKVSNDELSRIYPQYRILIFPSRFEANSMAVLEALSCGLPVLTSEVGIGLTLKQIIPEFVLPLNASTDDYEKLITIIENDYERFCLKAREYAVTYHNLKLYEEHWLQLLSTKISQERNHA